jgi:hypothetical protein
MPSACCTRLLAIALISLGVLGIVVTTSHAESNFFSGRCATSGCHTNDATSCNGCHHHMGTLHATANQTSYRPGDPVTVTFTGGEEHGWIRATLYDQNMNILQRFTGPTGTGNDGQANQVTFPVTFHVNAPPTTGDYIWRAAWFGNDDGAGHIERTTSVTIHVAYPAADVPDNGVAVRRTWGRIKSQYR